MKFGKALAGQLPRGDAWRQHALAYKQLKRLLKRCAGLWRHHKLRAASFPRSRAATDAAPRTDAALRASHDESAFFGALRDEIHKVNRFFLAEQRACGKRVQLLEDDIRDATRAMMLRRPATEAAGERGAKTTSDEWLRRAGDVYAQLHALECFCVLNFCAVTKILKKHDKWTAFRTRTRFERAVLVKQPFATYVPLLQLMRRVEAIALGVSIVALTEKGISTGSSLLLAGGYSGDIQPHMEFKLPPLRIAIGADIENDGNGTDSEDITPRYDVGEAYGYFDDEGSVFSEIEDQPPRQRLLRE